MEKVILCLMVLVLGGCASAPLKRSDLPVFYNKESVLQVTQFHANKSTARYGSLKIANQYCGFDDQIAMPLNEVAEYNGFLDEKITETARAARDVLRRMGNKKTSGVIGSVTKNSHYKFVLDFQCK